MIPKIGVFISSVQSEFAEERRLLFDYIKTDALLGMFFEPFIFEQLPALNQSVSSIYLKELEKCDIYLGLFGKDYGFEDKEGVSPTEREFIYASLHSKIRLVFISNQWSEHRHPKEGALIAKAEQLVVRKSFALFAELKSSVYASLLRYLEEKEYIRNLPFDAAWNNRATLEDIDFNKINEFVGIAKAKRSFPLPTEALPETVLTHLNLFANNRLCNAALLLFGKKPQHFFLTSEVKCAHFHGFEISKPIPSYQVYKGDVFQLVNQAVDFVLSKIDMAVGTRVSGTQVPIQYELPQAAISEAIVNAVAHRDYTSKGSVQVMLFKDRLEIWNPGTLPHGLSTAMLRVAHSSIPANPLLAESMYLAGYIERMGTGTGDIISQCSERGLKEPEFIQEEFFKTIIWRTPQANPQVTPQANPQEDEFIALNKSIKRVVYVLRGEQKRQEIQEALGLRDRANFVANYLNPACDAGYILLKYPEKPKHPQQVYLLSEKGKQLKKKLQKE